MPVAHGKDSTKELSNHTVNDYTWPVASAIARTAGLDPVLTFDSCFATRRCTEQTAVIRHGVRNHDSVARSLP